MIIIKRPRDRLCTCTVTLLIVTCTLRPCVRQSVAALYARVWLHYHYTDRDMFVAVHTYDVMRGSVVGETVQPILSSAEV